MQVSISLDISLAIQSRFFLKTGRFLDDGEEDWLTDLTPTFANQKKYPDKTPWQVWLKELADNGGIDALLIPWKRWETNFPFPSDRVTAIAVLEEIPSVWGAKWNFDRSKNRWETFYEKINLPPNWDSKSPTEALKNLNNVLSDLVKFCSASDEQWVRTWESIFAEALDDSRLSNHITLLDLKFGKFIYSPNGLLIKKVNKLGTFRGMGSWTDNYLAGEQGKIKDFLTRKLFHAGIEAACSAVNTWQID